MNTINTILRDGECVSPWQLITEKPGTNDKPDEATVYDCLVVGAGITGLTAALLLQSQGKRTVIAEAHTVGFGTTGGTSAHINTFADASYKDVESDFGEKNAELFARAIGEGIEVIRENIRSYQIECDFEERPGYIYAESEDQAKQLDDIYQASLKAGV
ncbi:MAG: FAD-dependent oxidoreductase, partial [Mucilaginibacter sp.]